MCGCGIRSGCTARRLMRATRMRHGEVSFEYNYSYHDTAG